LFIGEAGNEHNATASSSLLQSDFMDVALNAHQWRALVTRSRKMIGRTLAVSILVGCAAIDVVPLTQAIAVSPKLLQQASIITPEGVTVDPNNKEELKKYDNRHDLSELADSLLKEFGVTASQRTQLMACTGPVVCKVPSADGKRIDIYQASGTIALHPNILITVKHAFQDLDTGQLLPINTCRFHNWKDPQEEIAIVIDDPSQLPPIATSMAKTPALKRADMTAVRLAHPVEGCEPVSIPEKGAMLQKGDRVFEATAKQDGILSPWSGREPITQIGTIRQVFPSGPDGPLAYFADLSGGEGGSGGGVFRVINGQLSLAAIVQGAGRPEMDGKPYSEELYQNQSGLVGLDENVLHSAPALLPQPSPSP
jgi:hypothetical protein